MSNNVFKNKYKGYTGTIQVSEDDNCLYGKILSITDTILYEGTTVKELERAFHEAVNDYLETCKRHGLEPKKPLKGSLNVRIGEDLHNAVALEAATRGTSINEVIKDAIKTGLKGIPSAKTGAKRLKKRGAKHGAGKKRGAAA